MNDGLLEGLDFEVLPDNIAVHGQAVAPIITTNLYPFGGAGQMIGGGACFAVPPSTAVEPGPDLGMTTGTAFDPAGGSPITWHDGSNLTPQAGGKTLTVGGTGFGAAFVIGNHLANHLMPDSEPMVRDRLSPGGVRWGGNMHVSGNQVNTGSLALLGSQTVTSPPVDPTNMVASLVVAPRVTITGLPNPPIVGQSFGQSNYAAALIAPYVVSGPNGDIADTMYGLQVESNVYFNKPSAAACQSFGASIISYPQVAATTTIDATQIGLYASVSPIAIQGATNWWTSGNDHVTAAWFDVTPGTNITNATILNLTANSKYSASSAVTGRVTGTLVGIDFSAQPWAVGVVAPSPTGINVGSATAPSNVIGLAMGYEARFSAPVMFGSMGGATFPGTAAVFGVDIQGTGALGCISQPVLTSAPTNPSSGFAITYYYKGASSAHIFEVMQYNDAGTQRFYYMRIDAGTAGAAPTEASSLPT